MRSSRDVRVAANSAIRAWHLVHLVHCYRDFRISNLSLAKEIDLDNQPRKCRRNQSLCSAKLDRSRGAGTHLFGSSSAIQRGG